MKTAAVIAPVIAGAAGFSIMVVELSAVRVLAPSFGDSVPVWTNVIGVILLALALGALLGGRLADRGAGRKWLGWLLCGPAAFLFVVPVLAPRVAEWILPVNLPLDRAMPALVEGSLGVTLVVFAPPVLLLGSLSPILIRVGAGDSVDRIGRVSGWVYAAGTIGSLAGTFLATHLLVPYLGLSRTFAVAGVALGIPGIVVLVGGRGAAALVMAAGLIPGLLLDEPDPVWLDGNTLLARRDSRYQRLWVMLSSETVDGEPRSVVSLKINEGLDSFHSVRIVGTPFTNGRYYDSFALLPPALDALNPRRDEVRVLSLGCAAGSILRILHSVLGKRFTGVGVELDPAVLELGRRYFGLQSGPRQRLLGHLDARVYIDRVDRDKPKFDLICLDTYRSQIYIPAHLASREFFVEVAARLAPDGILALNVGDFSDDGPVLSAVAGTLASVFETVESFRVRDGRNYLVLAHRGSSEVLGRGQRPAGVPERIWARARRDGTRKHWKALPEDRWLTDSRSLLGVLHERIYSRLTGPELDG